jgi:hypothetical protein
MEEAGLKLKRSRERLDLRLRDVEEASSRLAKSYDNEEFTLAISRLADIENRGMVPNIFRLYALCAIYRLDFMEVLEWYGIDLSRLPSDALAAGVEKTHPLSFSTNGHGVIQFPLALDPGIDPSRTTYLSRLIQRWGSLPLMLLTGLDPKSRRYAFVGSQDWFMWPRIPPGSLLVIDETKRKPAEDEWTTDHDRPIYLFEHRDGHTVAWCNIVETRIILQPHPGSRCAPKTYEYPREIDVIGRVSAVAMPLDPGLPPRAHS